TARPGRNRRRGNGYDQARRSAGSPGALAQRQAVRAEDVIVAGRSIWHPAPRQDLRIEKASAAATAVRLARVVGAVVAGNITGVAAHAPGRAGRRTPGWRGAEGHVQAIDRRLGDDRQFERTSFEVEGWIEGGPSTAAGVHDGHHAASRRRRVRQIDHLDVAVA